MKKETVEAMVKSRKLDLVAELRKDGQYLSFSEEKGFIYELIKPWYGTLNRIVLSMKSGVLQVHEVEKICK